MADFIINQNIYNFSGARQIVAAAGLRRRLCLAKKIAPCIAFHNLNFLRPLAVFLGVQNTQLGFFAR